MEEERAALWVAAREEEDEWQRQPFPTTKCVRACVRCVRACMLALARSLPLKQLKESPRHTSTTPKPNERFEPPTQTSKQRWMDSFAYTYKLPLKKRKI